MTEGQLTLMILGLTAIIMLAAAIAAWKSAKSSRKMVYSQVIWQILDAYSSNEMRENMHILKNWKEYNPNDFGKKFIEMIHDKGERNKVEHEDKARRCVYHHFYKIKRLHDTNVLNESDVKLVALKLQVEFLINTVKPLDDPSEPGYDGSTYEFFEKLWQIGDKAK